MKENRPRPIPTLQYLGVTVGAVLLVAGILTGIFYISESSPVPSGSVLQTETFLVGPYLSLAWSCPTGFACPSPSYVTYAQPPSFAILPALPDTGLLLTVALVPALVTLIAAFWFVLVFYPQRTRPLSRHRPSPRLIGALGVITLAIEVLTLLFIPMLLTIDLRNSASGVPQGAGPWNSLLGTSRIGNLTVTWGPSLGFYLILLASALLIWTAVRWARSIHNSGP